jgi:hypothetical protein
MAAGEGSIVIDERDSGVAAVANDVRLRGFPPRVGKVFLNGQRVCILRVGLRLELTCDKPKSSRGDRSCRATHRSPPSRRDRSILPRSGEALCVTSSLGSTPANPGPIGEWYGMRGCRPIKGLVDQPPTHHACTARIGPLSIMRAMAWRWTSISLDGCPGDFSFSSPSGPRSLKCNTQSR